MNTGPAGYVPSIELRNIIKDYGITRALNNVNLTVYRGEVFGYIGANGAGKTTTIKIMTGLVRPTWGDAMICGHSIAGDSLRAKSKVGYVPESGALFEKLSAREYLTSMARLYGVAEQVIADRIEAWMDYFSLSDRLDRPIGSLSKGNKQKVCWTSALLHDPEVLILDEPLNGLDVEAISRVKELMAGLGSRGKTIFYSSHLIDIVEKLCTRIGVLHDGTLVGVGTPAEIREHFGAESLEQALLRFWEGRRQIA
jgi:ABC-2 type transport system ATP-binding protein